MEGEEGSYISRNYIQLHTYLCVPNHLTRNVLTKFYSIFISIFAAALGTPALKLRYEKL